jgi:hypothetical protein
MSDDPRRYIGKMNELDRRGRRAFARPARETIEEGQAVLAAIKRAVDITRAVDDMNAILDPGDYARAVLAEVYTRAGVDQPPPAASAQCGTSDVVGTATRYADGRSHVCRYGPCTTHDRHVCRCGTAWTSTP